MNLLSCEQRPSRLSHPSRQRRDSQPSKDGVSSISAKKEPFLSSRTDNVGVRSNFEGGCFYPANDIALCSCKMANASVLPK
jgi:hypothetical protein